MVWGFLALGALARWGHAADSVPQIIEQAKRSVVVVGTYQKTRSPPFRLLGTGFAVGDGTLVATNAHVVPATLDEQGLEVLAIVIPGGGGEGQLRQVSKQGSDPAHDLALLKLSGPPLRPFTLKGGTVREGETYLFTGFPIVGVLGPYPATHRAMISAITPIVIPSASANRLDPGQIRRIMSGAFAIFQLDATAYPGNSGSPLYDPDTGEVVGIINSVLVKSTKESALTAPSGITYAIPATHLEALLRASK